MKKRFVILDKELSKKLGEEKVARVVSMMEGRMATVISKPKMEKNGSVTAVVNVSVLKKMI